jgi:hypothetical protein
MKINEKEVVIFLKSFFIVSLTIFITRAFIYMSYILFAHTPKVATTVADTKFIFHHYLLGFLLLILGFVTKRNKYLKYLTWIGAGIVIEEWTVLIENLGFRSPIQYFSAFDVSAGLLLFIVVYFILLTLMRMRKKSYSVG